MDANKAHLRKALVFLIIVAFVFPASPSVSLGEEPMEALRRSIDAGIHILKTPNKNDTGQKSGPYQDLFEISREIFDFKVFSRLVLGASWKKFSPGQKEAFVEVFREFLEKFYLNKLQKKYQNETVRYVAQERIKDRRARVHIEVLLRNMTVPVKIMMVRQKEKWKVYDVSVLGISAVLNYRAQFKSVLRNASPAEVIRNLKNRVAELN